MCDLLAIRLLASQCPRNEAGDRLDGLRPMAHDEMQSPGPTVAEWPSDVPKETIPQEDRFPQISLFLQNGETDGDGPGRFSVIANPGPPIQPAQVQYGSKEHRRRQDLTGKISGQAIPSLSIA